MGEIETYKQEVEKNPDDAEAHYGLKTLPAST
jgi:hypothetical protein